jgi:RNA polymerase sigma-70 factor (ECF subfamily)
MFDEKTEIFEQHRRTLEGLAYRMLGTLAEARDVVQETYLKWYETNIAIVNSPRAWLITVCSRLALNQLQSARKQRELYIGEWLPEPLPDESFHDQYDPGVQAEINDTVSVALLLALEKLSPVERAVFILHDIFELSFDEVAQAIGKTSANCRQLATRARKRIRDNRPRFEATPEEHRLLLEGFMGAARQCDMEKLVSLLAAGVELYSDGGGKVEALPDVLRGAKDVAIFFVSVFSRYNQQGVVIRTRSQRFNGSLGVLVFEDEELATALTVETDSGRIHRIYAVRNPSKLSAFSPDDL